MAAFFKSALARSSGRHGRLPCRLWCGYLTGRLSIPKPRSRLAMRASRSVIQSSAGIILGFPNLISDPSTASFNRRSRCSSNAFGMLPNISASIMPPRERGIQIDAGLAFLLEAEAGDPGLRELRGFRRSSPVAAGRELPSVKGTNLRRPHRKPKTPEWLSFLRRSALLGPEHLVDGRKPIQDERCR